MEQRKSDDQNQADESGADLDLVVIAASPKEDQDGPVRRGDSGKPSANDDRNGHRNDNGQGPMLASNNNREYYKGQRCDDPEQAFAEYPDGLDIVGNHLTIIDALTDQPGQGSGETHVRQTVQGRKRAVDNR